MSSQGDNNAPRDLIHPIDMPMINTNPSSRTIRSVSESDAQSAAHHPTNAPAVENSSASATTDTTTQSLSYYPATTFRSSSIRSRSSVAHRRNRTGPAEIILHSTESNSEDASQPQPLRISSNTESFASVQRQRRRPVPLPVQYVPNLQGIALAKRLGYGTGRSHRGSLSSGEGSGSGAVFSAGSSQDSAEPIKTEQCPKTVEGENIKEADEKGSVAGEKADIPAGIEESVESPQISDNKDASKAEASLQKEKGNGKVFGTTAEDITLFHGLDEDAVVSNDPDIGPSNQRPMVKHTRDMTETSELLSYYQSRLSTQSQMESDFPNPVSQRSFNTTE